MIKKYFARFLRFLAKSLGEEELLQTTSPKESQETSNKEYQSDFQIGGEGEKIVVVDQLSNIKSAEELHMLMFESTRKYWWKHRGIHLAKRGIYIGGMRIDEENEQEQEK